MSRLRKVEIFDGTNTANVMATNGSYGVVVIEPNHISTLNSSTEILGVDEEFPGFMEDITNYAIIFVNVISNVSSATNGLCLEHSSDGVNWYLSECYTIEANKYKTFCHQCASKYFRVRYVNGGIAQTTFDLEVKLCTKNALDSSHKIDDVISGQDDARLVKSVLTAKNLTTDLFVPINASKSGNLQVTHAEDPLAIAKGEVVGSSDVNKFGNAPDFDESDGEVDIWDAAEDGLAWEQMNIILPTSNTIDSVSSSDALDTGIELTVVGLDINYNLVTQVPILDGQNRVALTTPLLRHFRSYNSNGTLFVGHIIIYENTAINLGVPIDTTKIQGVVHPENQQTEMAIYTIPAGYTGYLTSGYTSTAGSNKTSNYVIRFKIKEFNKVFRLQQKVAVSDSGTSFINFKYDIPQPIPEKADIKVTAEMRATGGTGASVSAGFSIILVAN